MTLPVEYRHECDTNSPAVRIFHGAKGAKEEDQKSFLCDLGVLARKSYLFQQERNITTKSTKDTM